MTLEELKQKIDNVIKENTSGNITAKVLNSLLKDITDFSNDHIFTESVSLLKDLRMAQSLLSETDAVARLRTGIINAHQLDKIVAQNKIYRICISDKIDDLEKDDSINLVVDPKQFDNINTLILEGSYPIIAYKLVNNVVREYAYGTLYIHADLDVYSKYRENIPVKYGQIKQQLVLQSNIEDDYSLICHRESIFDRISPVTSFNGKFIVQKLY